MRKLILVIALIMSLPSHSFAQNLEKISVPKSVTSGFDKLEYLLNAKEAMRIEHNIKGALLNKGELTETEFSEYLSHVEEENGETERQKIESAIEGKPTLTKEEFEDYKKTFSMRTVLIHEELDKIKKALEFSERFKINVEEIFTDNTDIESR